MPKNKIDDLNNLMFETIERLMDPDDAMDSKTAVAISQLGNVVLNGAKIRLQAAKILGSQNNAFFDDNESPKQIPATIRTEMEVSNCKCGEVIYPADLARSEKLKLDYPRCAECLALLPENAEDLNGGGK